jgi:hypothetical protein
MRLGCMLTTCSLTAALAAETRWDCTLDPATTYAQTTTVALPLAGTWIGNHDAVTNPAGTRTLPGLFGGSGNNPIPFTSTLRPVAEVPTTHPEGGFRLGFDEQTAAVRISGLFVDALAGSTGAVRVSMSLTYGSFRTVAPSSTFIGVSNLSVPLSDGQLVTVDAQQTADATAIATAAGPGLWDFAMAVPVQVRVLGTVMGNPFESSGAGTMSLQGRLDLTTGSLRVTGSGSVSDTVAVPAPSPLVNMPFDLPTILPPGSTAQLLMNGTFADGTAQISASTSLVAIGARTCAADLDGSGEVDAADLGSLLVLFGGSGEGDLDGSGEVDAADLGSLLVQFGPCG